MRRPAKVGASAPAASPLKNFQLGKSKLARRSGGGCGAAGFFRRGWFGGGEGF